MEREQRGNIAPSTIYIAHGLIFVSSPFFIRRFSWQELQDYRGTIVSSARFVYGPVDSLLLLVDEPALSSVHYLLLEMPILSLVFAFIQSKRPAFLISY